MLGKRERARWLQLRPKWPAFTYPQSAFSTSPRTTCSRADLEMPFVANNWPDGYKWRKMLERVNYTAGDSVI